MERQDGRDIFWERLPDLAKVVFNKFHNKYGNFFRTILSSDEETNPAAYQRDAIALLHDVKALAESMVSLHTPTYVVDAYTIDTTACALLPTPRNILPKIKIPLSTHDAQLTICETTAKTARASAQFFKNLIIRIINAYFASSPSRVIPSFENTDSFFMRYFFPMFAHHMRLAPGQDNVATLTLAPRFYRELRVLCNDIDNVVSITSACELALVGYTPQEWKLFQDEQDPV